MSFFGVKSPGHEGAGVVVKIGANVKNFKVGDRAGIKPFMDTCGSCELCWEGKENYCPDAVHTGLMCTGEFLPFFLSERLQLSEYGGACLWDFVFFLLTDFEKFLANSFVRFDRNLSPLLTS